MTVTLLTCASWGRPRSAAASPRPPVGGTREHRLDAAVARIAHRAVEAERARGLVGPGAVIDALHPALDLDSDGPPFVGCFAAIRNFLVARPVPGIHDCDDADVDDGTSPAITLR